MWLSGRLVLRVSPIFFEYALQQMPKVSDDILWLQRNVNHLRTFPNSIFCNTVNQPIPISTPFRIPEYIHPVHIKKIETPKIIKFSNGETITIKTYRFVSNHPALTDAQVQRYIQSQGNKQYYQRMRKNEYLQYRERVYREQAENFALILKHRQELQMARRREMAQVAFEGVPVVGRTAPVQELVKNKEYLPVTNIFSQLALYGPEEIREINNAIKQFRGNYTPAYDYKIAQHPFSYFRGTFLNKYINPFSDKCLLSKASAMKLCNFDKSLAETKFGYLVKKEFGYSEVEIPTDIDNIFEQKKLTARIIKSNSNIARLIGRTMLRLPLIGLIISGALEISHVAHEVNRGEDVLGEISQAISRFIGTNILTGIFGAIGSVFGPIGSIIGASLGAMSSAVLSKVFD